MARKKKENPVEKLVLELEELYLREDSEMAGRGLYQKGIHSIVHLGGHVDKNSALLNRIKEIVLELKELV